MAGSSNPFSDGPTNPYQSPTYEASSDARPLLPFTRQDARLRLLGPAIGLILFAVLWLLYMAGVSVMLVVDMQRVNQDLNGLDNAAEAAGFVVGMVIMMGLFVIPSLITFAGGVQMLRVKTYGFCWLAAITAVVPCTMCFPALLPFGIWGIIALYDSRMRPAFAIGRSPFQAS